MDRSAKQKINKETEVLNDTLDEMAGWHHRLNGREFE